MRHTKSHTANRRSHHALTAPKFAVDQETNVPHLRHRVCMTTGMYRGKKVLEPKGGKSLAKKA
jgi:ribosomal protein L32